MYRITMEPITLMGEVEQPKYEVFRTDDLREAISKWREIEEENPWHDVRLQKGREITIIDWNDIPVSQIEEFEKYN